jgi:hypothetical protein
MMVTSGILRMANTFMQSQEHKGGGWCLYIYLKQQQSYKDKIKANKATAIDHKITPKGYNGRLRALMHMSCAQYRS